MRTIAGKSALVTGAASGIGRATALALAAQGARLILCDVDVDGLARVAEEVGARGECLLARRVDVSNLEEMARFAEETHAHVPAVDILVNNAGVYLTGGLLDLTPEDWDWVLSVNLRGVIHGCHLFVPAMLARGAGGHVVNLSSMFGYWAGPGVLGYLTSKFAVFGFSEALREELRPHGIGVSTVCPGIIRTNMVGNMRIRNGGDGEGIRSRLSVMYRRRNYGPEKVAEAIVRAVRGNRGVVLVAPESRLMYHVERFFPWLSRRIAAIAARRMFAPAAAQPPETR